MPSSSLGGCWSSCSGGAYVGNALSAALSIPRSFHAALAHLSATPYSVRRLAGVNHCPSEHRLPFPTPLPFGDQRERGTHLEGLLPHLIEKRHGRHAAAVEVAVGVTPAEPADPAARLAPLRDRRALHQLARDQQPPG